MNMRGSVISVWQLRHFGDNLDFPSLLLYSYISVYISFSFSHLSPMLYWSNRCPRGHSQKRGGLFPGKRAAGLAWKQGENSSTLFMSFLFDLLSSMKRCFRKKSRRKEETEKLGFPTGVKSNLHFSIDTI